MNTENNTKLSCFDTKSSLNTITSLDSRGKFHCNGGDSEPDHDGGHGSDGDGSWEGDGSPGDSSIKFN